MYICFFSNRLNSHQAPISDELYRQTQGLFRFVELCPASEQSKKGSTVDYSRRPYLIEAWRSKEAYEKGVQLAIESEVAVFGAESLFFEVLRMKTSKKLAFEMSERWLKRGIINLLSPRLLRYQWYYHTLFYDKPLYKLCAGAFSANDQYLMFSFKDKCYKWGYFIENKEKNIRVPAIHSDVIRIMWCARFLSLKHPELALQLALRLKQKGYSFKLDLFGDGEELASQQQLANKLGIEDVVSFKGRLPNNKIQEAMREHDLFLFTSDRREGWGAVINEAMCNGCAVVAAHEIGSVPFMIDHRKNGCIFKSGSIDSLELEVRWLLDQPKRLNAIRAESVRLYNEYWTPEKASAALLQLIEDIKNGKKSSITYGPCSQATPTLL